MSLLSTHSGLRGPARELTRDVLDGAVGGFVALLAERGLPRSVAVARDERPEGRAIAEEAIELALAHGADVLDLGVAATPAAKVVLRRRGLGGAIVITGSHLAPDHNGVKLVLGPAGRPVDASRLPVPGAPPPDRGSLTADADAAAEDHVAAICAAVDVETIRSARLAVGVEGGAGASAALLLDTLGAAVPAGRADVTLRLDPDGDRLELTDERGVALDPELTLGLALLATQARTVVKGADTSRAIEALAERTGAVVHVVAPGEVHLFDALAEHAATGARHLPTSGEGAVPGTSSVLGRSGYQAPPQFWGGPGARHLLAGEGNGGVIVPAIGPGRDGLAAAAVILELVARTGRPLSALVEDVPSLARRRSTVPVGDRGAARSTLERLGLPRDDQWRGLEATGDGGAWGLVRLSATEPLLRVTTEAPEQPAADALNATLLARLREAGLAA